jgi:hypothetical protein
MANIEIPETYEALIAEIERDLTHAVAAKEEAHAHVAALNAEQAALGDHPNRAAYRHGGIPAARDMGVQHVLAHAGFFRLPYVEALTRLADARNQSGDDCLIGALRIVCESDPLLEITGVDWLGSHGLMKRGAIDPFWVKRPKLGLGQPAKLHGLAAADADAHRGLYTLSPLDLQRRFEAVAGPVKDAFGDLLPALVIAGGPTLAATGKAASEEDAATRYWAKCASFAAHQRATGDRRWRWKPPFSRQGHHAVTIARLKDVPLPAERTRGHAANWLDDNGANPRFRKD